MTLKLNSESRPVQVVSATNSDSPDDYFFQQLRTLHSMEMQMADALPEVALMAGDREIRELITMQVFRTGKRAARLAAVLGSNDVEVGSEVCEAMQGLIASGRRQLRPTGNSSTRDMMILAHCQRIQHYGLSAYEIASQLAESLGRKGEMEILESPVVEHRTAIRRLEVISDRLVGPKSQRKSVFPSIFNGSPLEWQPALAVNS